MVLSKFTVLEQKNFSKVFFFQFEKTANISWHHQCSLREAASPPRQRKNGERGEGAAKPMISSLPAKWRLKNERRNSNEGFDFRILQ